MSHDPRRSALLRFLSPGADTSRTQLKAYFAAWAVLLCLFVSVQFWLEMTGLRRALYALLALVSVTQMLTAVALLRKRR